MALSFIGITSKAGEAGGSWNIPLPGSAAAGDKAVIVYYNDNATSSPGPAGSSTVVNTATAWAKDLTAGEISDGYITFTEGSGNGLSGGTVMGVWRGADTVTHGSTTASLVDDTTALVSNSGLTSGGQYFAVMWHDDDLTTVASYPTDYTENRGFLQCGSAGSGGTLAWARATSLPTSPNVFVFNDSDQHFAIPIQINPLTVFDETISESATASGAFAGAASFAAAYSDSAEAAGTFAGGFFLNYPLGETASAEGSFVGGVDYGASFTETASATDSYTATVLEPGGWTIPPPPRNGWVEGGSAGGAWTLVTDTDTDWTER